LPLPALFASVAVSHNSLLKDFAASKTRLRPGKRLTSV
jgi:hypothetical protein